MFREIRRGKQALSKEECIQVLAQAPRGVLAVYGKEGYPYAFPMNFVYLNDKIYFHCATVGHKLEALEENEQVSFCVMDEGYRKDEEWALNIKSVIIFGKIKNIVSQQEKIELVRELGLRYYPTPESVEHVIEKWQANMKILELTVDHMSGKLVNES